MSTQSWRFAIVISEFNTAVTDRLLQGALQRLQKLSIPAAQYDIHKVPGAVEIPLAAQWCAQTEQYDAIITLGAVIRGETEHYDVVCQQVSQGCMRVSLTHNLPVIFGVLTTDNRSQALARAGGDHSDKGAEAVDTAMRMCTLRAEID